MSAQALLVLEDGNYFIGKGIGTENSVAFGEVVFNTSMSGYQEVCTDPSYYGQIVSFTYPHIGNVGINKNDFESDKPQVAGVILNSEIPKPSNWQCKKSFDIFLKENDVTVIYDIDTRELTSKIRNTGSVFGCILTKDVITKLDINNSLKELNIYREKSLTLDSVAKVSCKNPYIFNKEISPHLKNVVVIDFGVKKSILKALESTNVNVIVVPHNSDFATIKRYKPSGIVLSNGPGDPERCVEFYSIVHSIIKECIPLMGICLGFQILCLALGAKSYKMKFGHHGINHPIIKLDDKKVFISSQNHNYAIDEKTLPISLQATYTSLFDGSLQGVKHKDLPIVGYQGHPEAGPGPNESKVFFDEFINLINKKHSNIQRSKIFTTE